MNTWQAIKQCNLIYQSKDSTMQAFLITRKNPNNGFTETITHTGNPRKLPKGWKLHGSEKWRLVKKLTY